MPDIMKPKYKQLISLALLLLLAIGQVLSAPLSAPVARAQDAGAGSPLTVRSAALALDPERPEAVQLGRLRYLGGLILAADGDVFGGYSGIVIDPDGSGLWAISDVGHWLRLDFTRNAAGLPVSVAAARHLPLADAQGRPIESKTLTDAEALRRLPDGTWLVGFERAHRLWTYAAPGSAARHALSLPPGFEAQPANGGAEAVAVWPNGDLLVLSEEKEAQPGQTAVWLRRAEVWSELSWPARDGFRPTDAVAMPDGDILVLERFFTPLAGPKARISRVAAASIRPGTVLQPETLVEWARPLSVDNMEALDVRRGEDGGLWLYVMSDDNQNRLQRTLLMVFRLEQ